MIFSSPLFLFIFLPLALAGGFIFRGIARNIFLLIASLIFYTWGEGQLVLLLISSIVLNYFSGLGLGFFRNRRSGALIILIVAIILNVSLLIYFKYFNFILENLWLSGLLHKKLETGFAFPIGISFFTFQGISYLIDVYRRDADEQKNPLLLGLYISFFPQLISGPINRYPDISGQLRKRKMDPGNLSEGIIRFIRGLAKKVIIANTVGIIADQVFKLKVIEMPTMVAWLGIVCYTLQIYFDFSGYSDMAIGLARMFGFEYRENFNYPYIAKSIQEFWQRWHISFSSWLRDYLFNPIAIGMRYARSIGLIIAVLVTFFICGLWHGPAWHYIVWGLFHGLCLILEKIRILRFNKWPVIFRRFYVLLVVIIGWVLFRSDTLYYAFEYLGHMFGTASGTNYFPLIYVNNYTVFVMILAILFSTPIRKKFTELFMKRTKSPVMNLWAFGRYPFYLTLFVLSVVEIAQSGFNPFIYFRF